MEKCGVHNSIIDCTYVGMYERRFYASPTTVSVCARAAGADIIPGRRYPTVMPAKIPTFHLLAVIRPGLTN